MAGVAQALPRMGRPAGTMERKLTPEEVSEIVARCQVPDGAREKLLKDAKGLFGKAADDQVTLTRALAKESLWLLRELVLASPCHIVHADSRLGFCACCIGYETLVYVHVACVVQYV